MEYLANTTYGSKCAFSEVNLLTTKARLNYLGYMLQYSDEQIVQTIDRIHLFKPGKARKVKYKKEKDMRAAKAVEELAAAGSDQIVKCANKLNDP
ncbi:unnamed protein product [Toxocara canis]|uniref:DNA-directed DNA polymerase n=1 Tax=Toxocara canis TaxID=6265 RepID=A0A183UNF4_TOXCA|nr:unnamed protein product [Toxocara canis]